MLPSSGVASLPKALDPGDAWDAQSEGMFVLSGSATQHTWSFLALTTIKNLPPDTHTHTHTKQQLMWHLNWLHEVACGTEAAGMVPS